MCQQFIEAVLVDEIGGRHLAGFLGDGVRPFDQIGDGTALEVASAKPGKGVTHLTYRLNRG